MDVLNKTLYVGYVVWEVTLTFDYSKKIRWIEIEVFQGVK